MARGMPAETELRCRIGIPKGSAASGRDSVHALICPFDCCYFPDTLPLQLRAQAEHLVTAGPPAEEAAEIVAWCSADDVLTAIDDAAARWAATVNGRG